MNNIKLLPGLLVTVLLALNFGISAKGQDTAPEVPAQPATPAAAESVTEPVPTPEPAPADATVEPPAVTPEDPIEPPTSESELPATAVYSEPSSLPATPVYSTPVASPPPARPQPVRAPVRPTPAPPAPAPAPVRPAPEPTPPPAPEPPAPEPAPLEPVSDPLIANEINAFKTSTPLIDIPQSVTVFTEERLQDQGISSLAEVVDYTPGITNSQGEGHRDSIVFRGVRSTADFFIDGVRDDVQYYRPLYNVERIEILRGPSALHFGRGGTGGILNRVTKKPIIDDYGYNQRDYKLSVDTFGATNAELDINQAVGSDAAFRFNTYYEILNNHRDFYDGDRYGINPTFGINLSQDTRLDFSYEYNDHQRFIDRGVPSGDDGLPVTSLVDTVFGDPELNETTFQAHTFRTSLKHRFNDIWKGKVTAFYGDYDKVYQNFFPVGYDSATDQVDIDGYVDNTQRQNFVLSGHLVGEFETGSIGHKVIAGGEYTHTSSDQNRFNALWDTSQDDVETFAATGFRLNGASGINSAGQLATANLTTDLNDDTRVTIDTYSTFIQDEIALGNKLDVVLGARFDSFDIEVIDAEPGGTGFRSRTDQAVSPRLGVIYKPFENISFYGSFSESFLPRSGEQFADINGDDNVLDPNTSSNLEAGVNWNIKDNLALRMALFEIEESSPQVADSDPGTLDIIDTVTTGFEFEFTGYLTDQWYISAGYTYLDGEQVDEFGPTGLRPRELPENLFSIWNKFQATERLGLGLGLVHQDDSFAGNNNEVTLPKYTRIDAAAFYKLSEKTKLQFNIENLFDTEYFPNSHTNDNITVGRPINATFSIKSSF